MSRDLQRRAQGISNAAALATFCILLLGSRGAAETKPPVPASSSEPRHGVWEGLEVKDLEGWSWTADQLLGRVVLVDFWATWCAPCLDELPTLRRIRRQLSSEGVEVLGVALDAMDANSLRGWLRHHDVDWAQIHERRMTDGPVARRFAVEAVPRTIVVDRRGRLVAVDLRGEALFTVLRDLAKAQSVP